MGSESQPFIDSNPELESYYDSLESKIGYSVFLSGARHFGYWERDTYWPFPLGPALRAMEDKVAESLMLPPGSHVLDAGCGVGKHAIYLAKKYGYRILGIDVIDYHLAEARRHLSMAEIPASQVEFRKMDYHHLESLGAGSFDGIYTLETLVHATDLDAVLNGFHRLLIPGGRIAFFEYDHDFVRDSAEANKANATAPSSASPRERPNVLKGMLEDAGFADVVVRDYTDNIKPMTRIFYLIGYVPWVIVTLLGLERYFINIVAVVEGYREHEFRRYTAISATKQGGPLESSKNR